MSYLFSSKRIITDSKNFLEVLAWNVCELLRSVSSSLLNLHCFRHFLLHLGKRVKNILKIEKPHFSALPFDIVSLLLKHVSQPLLFDVLFEVFFQQPKPSWSMLLLEIVVFSKGNIVFELAHFWHSEVSLAPSTIWWLSFSLSWRESLSIVQTSIVSVGRSLRFTFLLVMIDAFFSSLLLAHESLIFDCCVVWSNDPESRYSQLDVTFLIPWRQG